MLGLAIHNYVNSLLSCLDFPSINRVTFKAREREVEKAVESVARETCVGSSCKEREMAILANTAGSCC